MYVLVRSKFLLALLVAIAWCSFSIWASRFWFEDLSAALHWAVAIYVIGFVAIVPGFMNAFVVSSLLLDRRPARRRLAQYPPLTILIAAYNERDSIRETLESIRSQHYPAELEVIVVSDGSTDGTDAVVEEFHRADPRFQCIHRPVNAGKAAALNLGLSLASHRLMVTLDADSLLYGDALLRLVERYFSDPPNTRAVAGTVLARNSRENWVAKAQEWDYFHGIATTKRIQSLYQGTLVAQGAFSIYHTDTLREVGGWPQTVGEDIVLTWALLKRGYRVGYCEDGVVFTIVPSTLKAFVRQRQRWARGMIEAFKAHPSILITPRLTTFYVWWDLLFPFMDIAYCVFFIPGLILALGGNFMIVGPMTLSLLPLSVLINGIMFRVESRMFAKQGLRVRENLLGFLMYALPYGLVLQPSAVAGYIAEFSGARKFWGTK
ncbi:MAG: glycosyltransferase family 2 protein [Betaproteobacteria bacterium]|nr:glycosyltransferase family 2 protein [Betaproteobacteria bacterium]NCA15433.1 glycosyltransferase family 2 protein [Betaproteobacteria bacterium]